MISRQICTGGLLFLRLLLPNYLHAQEQNLSENVRALENRYRSVQSISARFTQIYRGPGIEQTEAGILFMKKPGLMRWEYRTPETKLFIVDGRRTYLYVPADRQVTLHPFRSADLRSTPLRFLLGQGEISKSFRVSREREFTPAGFGTYLLRLEPQETEPEYAYVVVECDEKSHDLRRLVIRERTGNLSEFHFSEITTNIRIDEKQFRFKIPKGVEVVEISQE